VLCIQIRIQIKKGVGSGSRKAKIVSKRGTKKIAFIAGLEAFPRAWTAFMNLVLFLIEQILNFFGDEFF
jgi:hypothetical protein